MITAILHLVNGTPIDWYSRNKQQLNQQCTDLSLLQPELLLIKSRETLMYLGVPIKSKSSMFKDNKSVVTSSMILISILSKRHHISSYHHIREAIASKFIGFYWNDGKDNLADILSKLWQFASIWPLLKPLLFWRGDTKEADNQQKGSDTIPTNHQSSDPGDGGSNSSLAGS